MPILLQNNIVGVTKEELICEYTDGLWNTWNSLKSQIDRDKDKAYGGIKKVEGSVGGHGRKLLIDYDSLPHTVQQLIKDPRKVDHILERYYLRDQEAVAFYSSFKTQDGQYLHLESQNRYIMNASVMKALVQLKQAREIERKSKGGSLRGIIRTLATDAETFKPIMERKYGSSHNIPTSKRFAKAFRDFKRDSYISLIKDLKGVSKKNAQKVTEDTVELLNNMFAGQNNKPNPTEIHVQYNAFINNHLQVINDETGEIYEAKNFSALSESSIRNYLTAWENQIGTHAKRNGDRQKYMTKFTPHHSFEQPTLAGSIISVDDRQPPFEYEKGKRIWFYNGIDLASEAFTVWVYGKSKEGIILEFYRQMVRNYAEWGFNLPAELECESSLNSSFKDTFLKEGNMFQYRQMYANKARSKRIERYYGELRYKVEKEREGWLARPFALSEANQISNVPRMTVPYDLLAKECLRDIMTWNNMEHSKIKGKTRWEVFCETQNPDLRPTNYQAFMPYLGHKTESSCNAGITRMNNRMWLLGDHGKIETGEALIHLMKQVEGRDFDIRWLDANDGTILKAFVYVNDRYICELLPKPKPNKAKIERTAADNELMALMTRYEATVNGFMKTQKNSLDTVTIIDSRKKTLNNKFQIPGLQEAYDLDKNEDSQITVPPIDEPTYDGEEEYFNYRNPANDL
tara:strand:+ start:9036 stop:11093 length:2058 start_codon:yes stop_codon:yes gene_type:complete